MGQIVFNIPFINNKNVRNFNLVMDSLKKGGNERGRFVVVSGKAGFGKTTTADKWHVENPSVFIRMRKTWRTSELPFLQDLCRELHIPKPPARKDPAFMAAVDVLIRTRTPVFIDEVDKFKPSQATMFLEILRDLTDLTGAPVIVIGEEGLPSLMQQSTRVSSRTVRHLEFLPLDTASVIAYAKAATGGAVALDVAAAQVFQAASGGDIRIIERDVENLVGLLNARGAGAGVDADLAAVAVRQGLQV